LLAANLSTAVRGSIFSGTLSAYASAAQNYTDWCDRHSLAPWPCDEVLLAGWMMYLGLCISVLSIPGYLSAIKFAQPLISGYRWTCGKSILVQQTLRHLRKKFGDAAQSCKFPITLAVLRIILPLLPGWPSPQQMSHNDRMFAAASLIATCAFLRGGEFTTHAGSTRDILTSAAVCISAAGGRRTVTVSIPRPENFFWLEEVDAHCFDSPEAGEFSPVRWLELYRSWSSVPLPPAKAAFRLASGAPLSRDFMVKRSNDLFREAGLVGLGTDGKPMAIKASSWRSGGAMSAVQAGVSDALIMALGRWRSIAWRAYTHFMITDLEVAACNMWRSSVASSSPTPPHVPSQQVGVPTHFQDAPLDVAALQTSISNRRCGSVLLSQDPHPLAFPQGGSVSRQCG
jgi:hypothetical protein